LLLPGQRLFDRRLQQIIAAAVPGKGAAEAAEAWQQRHHVLPKIPVVIILPRHCHVFTPDNVTAAGLFPGIAPTRKKLRNKCPAGALWIIMTAEWDR
jgi:hypothetical protein